MNLRIYVAEQLKDLRENHAGGHGVSQQVLAKAVGTTPNTISRWETGTYRPKIEDLEKLSRFFGVKISHFFPRDDAEPAEQPMVALLRAAKGLDPQDLEELRRYAEFRRSRTVLATTNRRGRKPKKP